MKIHRFITTLDQSGALVDRETIKQIYTVLKLKPGEVIIVSDGKGTDQKGTIESIEKNKVMLKSVQIIEPTIPQKNVTLYCAILKKENFELVCQKATELGVTSIVPIISERTIKQGLRIDRLEKIIKEASEQSGLSLIPKLLPATNFRDAILESIKNHEATVLFEQSKNKAENVYKNIGILVGPEGGFTGTEISFAKENGAHIVSLGITTLRGETAAIVGSYWALK